MKKNILLIYAICFTLKALSADLCVSIYDSTNVKNNDLKLIVTDKKSPFDVARLNRSKTGDGLSDSLLDQVENKLLRDRVIKIEDLGGGVNASYKITFESGLKAAYKPVNPDRANQPIREAVAYKLSRIMGLDIVPPTVVRKLTGDIPIEFTKFVGSVQLFISTAKPLEKGKDAAGNRIILNKGLPFDPDTSISGRRLRIFDWLINNHDRGSNAGNYLISNTDDYIIGIDHSVSFVGHDKQARSDKVPYYKDEFLQDRELYNKLTSVSREEIRQALEGLNPKRIDEFFERYDQLILDFKKVLN
jgi:hypothetical protein